MVSLIMTTTAVTTAQANDCKQITDQCNLLLNQADAIITEQERIIGLQTEQIDHQKTGLQLALESIAAEKERADAWYRQPQYVVPISFLLGAGSILLLQGAMSR